MPLVWKIDPANSLIVAVANGDVKRPEVEKYFDAIIEGDALAYRKVFDVHKGDTSMTADDVFPLGVRMRSLPELGPMGPLAVVLPAGRGTRLQRALGMVATAKRPMRVFDDPLPAYRWIAKQDLPGAPTDPDELRYSLEWSEKTRELARHIKLLASACNEEARGRSLDPPEEIPGLGQNVEDASDSDREVLYRGQADLEHRGESLNICVRRRGHWWEFRCCRDDRRTLGTLLTLGPRQIAALQAEGHDPLERTLNRIKWLVHAGFLEIPESPIGRY